MHNKKPKVFHYTIGSYLPKIIESGEIKLSEAGVRRPKEYAAWFSINPDWEETANKMYRTKDGEMHFGTKETTHKLGGGLARIEIEPEASPFKWGHYVRKSKISKANGRRMLRAAFACGSSPASWRVSFNPVGKDKWLNIEMFNWETQAWEPYTINIT